MNKRLIRWRWVGIRHPRVGGGPCLEGSEAVDSRPRPNRGQALRGNDARTILARSTEWRRWVFSVFAALIAISTHAHHSVSNFNFEVDTTVSGTVKYFSFTNPHSFIDVEIKDEQGVIVLWKVFATSKVVLQRYGWSPSSVKVGDTITVTGHPDKTKPREMYLTKIKFANGVEWLRSSVDN